MERSKKLSSFLLPAITAVVLFVIPFFWFAPGEMDLGGDSSRLYFFDPTSYLTSHTLYGISASSQGVENISYYGLPFILLLVGLKSLLRDPTTLIAAFHGMTLSVGFLSVYGSVVLLLSDMKVTKRGYVISTASIVAGLLYIFAPGLLNGWDKVILTHNQVFLNPLLFFLLLHFFRSNKFIFLILSLLITVLFSPNFSYTAAPPFFAFYPLTLIFLITYSVLILKKGIPIGKLSIAALFFILLHAFHLLPQLMTLLDTSSPTNQAVFSDEAKYSRGLDYFTSVAANIKVSNNMLLLPQDVGSPFGLLFFIFSLISIIAFVFNKSKVFLLLALAFLITFFFASANITNIGFSIYAKLFSIPGFSMFRNYYGQWVFAFSLYYSLLFGCALAIVIHRFSKKSVYIAGIVLSIVILINGLNFINGSLVNKILWKSDGRRIFVRMDPAFLNAISKIKSLPIDGKVLTIPLTDPGYEMFSGANGGIYQGPSAVSYLTGKKDFAGIQEVDPFDQLLLTSVKKKDYETLRKILGLLNIKYIFYNADPSIYDAFPEFPYETVKTYLPENQKAYGSFIDELGSQKIADFGKYYAIYETPQAFYTPHIYVPKETIFTNDPVQTLEFASISDSRLGIFNLKDNAALSSSNLYIKLQNIGELNGIFDNYHLHTYSPFISQRPDSLFYFYVVLKEKNELDKAAATSLDEYLTQGLFLSTKRIAELEQFGSLMNVRDPRWDRQSPSILASYNSWEASFTRYEDLMRSLIASNNTKAKSPRELRKNQIIIHEQLLKHQPKLQDAIKNSSKSQSEKDYLLKRTRKLFGSLIADVNLPKSTADNIPYSIDLDTAQKGRYIVSLKKSELVDTLNVRLAIDGVIVNPSSTIGDYLTFGPVDITDPKKPIHFLTQPANLLDAPETPQVSEEKDTKKFDQSNQTFAFNNETTASFDGVIKTVSKWEPNTQYVITFDYRTYGDDFLFKFYEKKKDKNKKISINAYVGKLLNANDWKTHQTILTSDRQGIKGYLQFLSNNDNEKGSIEIRNLSVVKVPNPTIFLQKVGKEDAASKTNDAPPIVTFMKVNPTRYEVRIENIERPFMLVLSDAFNQKWKVYPNGQGVSGNVADTYFDNSLIEYSAKNSFFDKDMLETLTKQPIPENQHYLANGYANGWFVDPSYFQNKKTINLTIEFTTQRMFLLGLVISLLSFVLSVLLLLSLLANERKK